MVEQVARAQGNDKREETGARKGADPGNGQWGALSKCTEDEWGRRAAFQVFSVSRAVWGSRGSENLSEFKRSNWGAIQQAPGYIYT